jgi:HEAT repeat protein
VAVRRAAVDALLAFKGAVAPLGWGQPHAAALVASLEDPSEPVRSAAAEALAALGEDVAPLQAAAEGARARPKGVFVGLPPIG